MYTIQVPHRMSEHGTHDYEHVWPPYNDAAALLDGATEVALRSAADAPQATQDDRLTALEQRLAHMELAVHRLLYPGEVLP